MPKSRSQTYGQIARAALEESIAAAGGVQTLAARLGINRQAVYRWDRVPAERVVEVERQTGVPREELRPDLFLTPRPPGLRPVRLP